MTVLVEKRLIQVPQKKHHDNANDMESKGIQLKYTQDISIPLLPFPHVGQITRSAVPLISASNENDVIF